VSFRRISDKKIEVVSLTPVSQNLVGEILVGRQGEHDLLFALGNSGQLSPSNTQLNDREVTDDVLSSEAETLIGGLVTSLTPSQVHEAYVRAKLREALEG
jgi:hypothetical protein